jgi:hypothetical protein
MTAPVSLAPIVRSVQVPWDPSAAFRRFTAEIDSWWPLRTHSVGQDEAALVEFEGRVGGRIVERVRGGRECVWGTVTVWDPPNRVGFTWHPGRSPDTAQQVDVRFSAAGAGTRVELEHGGWERYGKGAAGSRRGYGLGWQYVLAIMAGRGGAPIVRVVDVVSLPILAFRRGRRLFSAASVALLLVAAAHTFGHVQPVHPGSAWETITEEMAAVAIRMPLGMTPSTLDILKSLSLTMTIALVWLGIQNLVAAGTGDERLVRRQALVSLVFNGALVWLFWHFRVPPPLVTLAVVEALFLAAVLQRSFMRDSSAPGDLRW